MSNQENPLLNQEMPRKKVNRKIDKSIDFEGQISEVIHRLKELEKKFKDKENLRIVSLSKEYEDGYEYVLMCDDLENDCEYKYRMNSEKTNVNYRKAMYERLKKEFETGR